MTKDTKWEVHLQDLEKDLRTRIGVLRRLSWRFQKHTVIQCFSSIFTSKLNYSLVPLTDPLRHEAVGDTQCQAIVRLQRLQNEAIRAALRVKRTDKVSQKELLERAKQLPVVDLAKRAHFCLSWNVFSEKGKEKQILQDRVEWGVGERVTRHSIASKVPSQRVQGTIVAKLAKAWNSLPEDIKHEVDAKKARDMIKKLFE